MNRHASAALVFAIASSTAWQARATVDVDGKLVEVVDMHLHPGEFGQMASEGKAFLIGSTPDFTRLYSPAVFSRVLDPYAPQIGIQAQTRVAGIDHVALFAVYTHHTTGYFTNTQLERLLLDPRNVSTDSSKPWAWGYVSINFFDDWSGTSQDRLDALASFFEARRDLFIGIKLAHAHQAVAFDDPAYQGVYAVAAKYHVPVLLHTGFSPFPNSKTDPHYYDPVFLEAVVKQYDGSGPDGRVDFVLSHVGQGDPRAVDHVLAMAEKYSNLYLEISALNRPFLLDDQGNEVQKSEPQYPYVLAQIKQRGLASRTLFGTDGPQFSGFVSSYLDVMLEGMKEAGFTADEVAGILSGNFYKLHALQP